MLAASAIGRENRNLNSSRAAKQRHWTEVAKSILMSKMPIPHRFTFFT
jgi:hypothetical protein